MKQSTKDWASLLQARLCFGFQALRRKRLMNKVFDKLKPVFEAIAANKYISAIRDGFIACMPIIIFSSIFMM
ncbi:hypothetical protein GBD12_12045, partial [Bifidobacterium longum]